jgi:hypothetical protein
MSAYPGLSGVIIEKRTRFPKVEGTAVGSTSGTGTTSFNAPLPSSIQAGEMLLLFVAAVRGSAVTVATPSGWTQLYNVTGTGNIRRFCCFYKTASGSEGSTVAVTISDNAVIATNSYRISSFNGVPEAATPATGTSTSPDSPNLTPTWGADETLWISPVARQSTNAGITAPANYTNVINKDDTGANPLTMASARREQNASSENPAAWAFTGSAAWVAGTVAVRGVAAMGVSRLLDSYSNVTGAWSMSRTMLSSFAGNALYDTATGVSSLKDQTGNGRHLVQATAANQPSIVAAGPNNRAAANFSGVNLSLAHSLASDLITASTGYIVAAVIKITGRIFSIVDSSETTLTISGNTLFAINNDGAPDLLGLSIPAGAEVVVCEWMHEGGSFKARVNGGSWQSTPSGNTLLSGIPFIVGASHTVLFEMAAFNAIPSEGERDALVANMLQRYADL